MTLAGMIKTDRDALLCDLAETYGIYDIRSLPVQTIATLSSGLRDNSRIKMKLRGETAVRPDLIPAMIYDLLREMLYAQGILKDKPDLITDILTGTAETQVSEYEGFNTIAEFNEAYHRIGGA